MNPHLIALDPIFDAIDENNRVATGDTRTARNVELVNSALLHSVHCTEAELAELSTARRLRAGEYTRQVNP